MKAESLTAAIVGGIVAGAAFGAGFAIAGKGLSKLGKKEKEVKDVIDQDMAVTKPYNLPAGDGGHSNLVGTDFGQNSWSNLQGFSRTRKIGTSVNCLRNGIVGTASSAGECNDLGGQVVTGRA